MLLGVCGDIAKLAILIIHRAGGVGVAAATDCEVNEAWGNEGLFDAVNVTKRL